MSYIVYTKNRHCALATTLGRLDLAISIFQVSAGVVDIMKGMQLKKSRGNIQKKTNKEKFPVESIIENMLKTTETNL